MIPWRAAGTAATLMLSASAAAADDQPAARLYTTVSVASEHRFDGSSASNRKPVGQASVYLWRRDKLYAGMFVTGVDYGYAGSPSVEVDLYAGRHFNVGRATRVSVQALYSLYPDRSGPGPTYDFLQFSAKVQRQAGKLAVTGAVDLTPHGSFGAGQGWRVSAEAAHPVTGWLTVSGRVAHREAHRGPPRNAWDLGATARRGPVSLDLRYYATSLERAQCYGTDWCEPAVVGKLSYDLPFGH